MSAEEKQEVIKILKDPNTIKQVVENVFKEVDTDKSGFIEKNEFAAVAKKVSKEYKAPEPTDAEITEALKAIDANNDGKISKEELGSLIKSIFDVLIMHIEKS